MLTETIGYYLDRAVILQEVSSVNELDKCNLSHAMVLLWLGGRSWDREDLKTAIKCLAANKVLALTVAGERADEAFSTLLETLGPLPMDKHTMTGVINNTDVKDPAEDSLIVEDAIEQFVKATWPSEERFDDWTEYRIIVVGRPDLSRQIRQSLTEILR